MHLSSVDTAAHCPTAEHLLQENDDTRTRHNKSITLCIYKNENQIIILLCPVRTQRQ